MIVKSRRPEVAVMLLCILQEQLLSCLLGRSGDADCVNLAPSHEVVVEATGSVGHGRKCSTCRHPQGRECGSSTVHGGLYMGRPLKSFENERVNEMKVTRRFALISS